MAQVTLLDIAKLNGSDAEVGLIEESLVVAPEVARFPAKVIRGVSYPCSVRLANPAVTFRNANEGQTAVASVFAKRQVECFILDAQIRADKAVADSYEEGADSWKAIEAAGVMKGSLATLGRQVWYGSDGNGSINKSGDAKGFPGALGCYNPTDMEVDATGSSATTGSSVWGVCFGPQEASLVFGNNSTISLGDWQTQQVLDSNSKPYTAYTNGLTGWAGMQVGHKNCLGRIRDLTADSGKGLTDALLSQLLGKFLTGIGRAPDAYFMTVRSLLQLQASRTATSPSGAPAPIPTDFMGVPLIWTNSLLNTETLV